MLKKGVLGALCVAATVVAYSTYTAFNPSPTVTAELVLQHGGKPFVLRDGRVMEYFVHGNSNGNTTILALHGASTTGNLFSLLDQWARDSDVKIIAPTLPGFGLTAPMRSFDLLEWVKDMEELLSSLGVDKFHVLGTSLGSCYAGVLVGHYQPTSAVMNVELYVAFAPAAPGEHDPLEGSVLQAFAQMRPYPLTKRVLEKLVFLPMLRYISPPDGDVARSLRWQWEGLSGCTDVIYAPWRYNWTEMANARRVVIISGRSDTSAPPHNQRRLHTLIAGSELVEYDGEHTLSLERPAMMVEHVKLLL